MIACPGLDPGIEIRFRKTCPNRTNYELPHLIANLGAVRCKTRPSSAPLPEAAVVFGSLSSLRGAKRRSNPVFLAKPNAMKFCKKAGGQGQITDVSATHLSRNGWRS